MMTTSVGRQVLDCTTLRTPLARNHTLQRLLSALLVLASFFLVSPAQAQSLCYAVADSGDTLVSMNNDGTNFTSIGNTGTSNIEAIAMEPGVPNTLFAADAGQFGQINLSTGAFTAIGSGIGTGSGTAGSINLNDIDSLAFDIYTGILWGVHRRGSAEDLLIQIDHTTGSFIPNVFSGSACGATSPCDYVVVESDFAPINHADIDDISIHPASRIMYAIANSAGGGDRLVQIDMRDGTVTDVGALGVDDMEGFSQFNGGTLYGTTGNGAVADADDDSLWSINITTGAATHIAQFGSGTDYESVSCLTEDGNVITGTVFNDTANLGTFDVSEGGVAGVTVRLYIDENNDGVVDSGDTLLATRTTDSNGAYQFNLGIQDNFVLAVDTTTIPSGGSLSTDNVEEADFSTYGNTDSNNDFGIKDLPALGIVKSSNASGNIVAAGDFITYTIQIQNLSGTTQTGVTVSDPLPSNTSYVAQSTVAQASPASTSQETYRDEFTNIAYNGTNGSINWSGSVWTEEKDNGGGSPAESNGNILVATSGSCTAGNCLRIQAKKKNDRIYRQADLSSCTAATVSYDYNNQLSGSDDIRFQISGDGGSNYTDLKTYNSGNTGSGSESFVLTASQRASNTRIRFYVKKDNQDQFLFIDDVQIACNSSFTTKDNIPGGTNLDLANGVPSNLVQSSDGFNLAADATLTVTFKVQVANPLAAAVTQISNTASVTTDQVTTAITASVTDYVPHLDSYEGDNAGSSTYLILDELFYRDPSTTGKAETALYTGGQGYLPNTPYDVVYYDADGVLVFTDTNATSDGTGFLESAYTVADGLDTADPSFAYGQWTAVVITDGSQPPASLSAVNDSNSLSSDTFDVRSWSIPVFTDSSGTPVTTYDVPGGETTAYLTLTDLDQNTDATTIQTVSVTIVDSETGDTITVTLYETGVDTGIFANNSGGSRLGIPLSLCSGGDPGPSTLCVTADSFLNATYTDASDSNDASSAVVTTPVTLRSFSSVTGAIEGDVIFEWSTATEVGNLGFDLYVKQGGQWVRINVDPIASPVIDSLEVTDYTYDASGVLGKKFQLVDIDITGKETRHGPFKLGKEYGQSDSGELIDWNKIKRQNKDKKKKRKEKQRDKLRQTTTDLKALNLLVAQDGIQRVTYEQLAEAGLDLQGVKVKKLALLNRGASVPMWVEPQTGQTGRNPAFGPGGFIEFLGYGLNSLYTTTNVYTLKVKQAEARRVAEDFIPALAGVTPEPYYMETTQVAPEAWYSFAAPNGDPWYAEQVLAWGGPYAQNLDIHIDEYVAGTAPASVLVGMWGVTAWPSENDHHVRVRFNGDEVGDEWFDGLSNHPVQYGIPAGNLQEGHNTITVELPLDTGEIFDLVNVDHWQVTYPRRFMAKAGQLTFTAGGHVFAVAGLSDPDVVVYRIQVNGMIERLMDVEVEDLGGHYQARFRGMLDPATYYVTSTNVLTSPEMVPLPPKAKITRGNAHYLIIAHPDFIDDNDGSLDAFAAAKKAQGFKKVKIVDVEDIYAEFGHYIVDPQAIKDYIAYAAAKMKTQMVLLVGGDTYDYHNYMGLGAVSFIPSLYTQTDPIVHYAPVDAKYVDLDGDNVPDIPIGRLPVRTSEELAVILAKTQAYEQQQSQTALFAADLFDEYQNYSFTGDSDAMLAMLPPSWTTTKAYGDEVGIEAARNTIMDTLEAGVALTNFTGHSGPIDWTFWGLFNSGDAAGLTNATTPTVVTQWGCWNTYFVSPFANTLGHTFMLNPNGGAAAVLGASTLTGAESERALGIELYSRLFTPGVTLGEAIVDAKQAYAQGKPNQLDVLLGWNLLGDPALVIQP